MMVITVTPVINGYAGDHGHAGHVLVTLEFGPNPMVSTPFSC